jgi:ADP-heptose:LPS heptosyltransferase
MTRLLALIPGGIGDQFLCFPMLESLQQKYPQAQIDVVIEPRAQAAYRVSRVVKQILTYNFPGRTGPADWGNLIGWVREREYDALISLESSRFGGFFLWLMAVPKRVGFSDVPSALFMTDQVLRKPQQYAAQMYHDLLGRLEVTHPCPPLSVNVPRADIAWAEAAQTRLALNATQGYILVHGGSLTDHQTTGAGGIYPQSSWKSLIKGLQERQPNLPVLLVQFPGDREWFRPIQEGCPGLKVLMPEDFGKFAALIAGASLMICTESDAMHLAVALGTYLFTLFGATDPAKVLPVDQRFTPLRSPTGTVADIAPIQVLEKVWGK